MTNPYQIADHSRAAFYLLYSRLNPARGAGWAWQIAERAAGWKAEADAEAEQAAADLGSLWESLGKIEPKQHSPEGQALAAARAALRKAQRARHDLAAYAPASWPRPAPYVGTWQPSKAGHYYAEQPARLFRDFDTAAPAGRGRVSGYYMDSYQEQVAQPVVAQLTGKGGQARYVAGWQNTEAEGGATFDLGTVYADAEQADARAEAERAAHSMAEQAAEAAREYDAAWQAGSQWAQHQETIAEARKACLALLAERKEAQARAGENLPAICAAIRDSVAAWRRQIKEARAEAAELAAGQAESLWWCWGSRDESGLVAFAEGAELDLETARGVCS